MAAIARYTYQIVSLVSPEEGEWVEDVAREDGVSKAHVIRQVFSAGRDIVIAQRQAARHAATESMRNAA